MHMDSAFHQYLGTNYVPSPDEVRQIQEVVNNATSEVHDLDIEINQLQQQIDILHEKRSRALDFAEQHQALISPARRLTEDVLACIFLACLPEDRNPGMYAQDAPSLLTQICRSWRRVALSTPRLWAAFHVILPVIEQDQHPVPNELERQTELACRTLQFREFLVNRWIELSGVCPLSISIQQLRAGDMQHDITEEAKEALQELKLMFIPNTILPFYQRWYSLDIYVHGDILEDLIDTLVYEELQLTALKELHLARMSSERSTVNEERSFNDFLSILPSDATSATFHNLSSNDVELMAFQWSHITELNLNLTFNTVNLTSSLLRKFPSLISLTLNSHTWRENEDTQVIVLQHLKTLRLPTSISPHAMPITKFLYMPSLTDLDLQIFSGGNDDGGGEVEEVLMSLVRATKTLHTLTFSYLHWTRNSSHLTRILKRLPTLKCLKINSVHNNYNRWSSERLQPRSEIHSFLNDNLLLAFTPNDSKGYSDIVCPKLEEFDCSYEMLTEFSESTLKALLVARRKAHLIDNRISPLRRVHVFINDYKRMDCSGEEETVSLGADSAIHFRRRPKGRPHSEYIRLVTDTEAYTQL